MNEYIVDIQKKCLEITKVIDEICRKNNIQYSLSGGSAVGAHLHKGFVPWDDDVDIFMTRENYIKFLRVCKTDLPKYYSLQLFEDNMDSFGVILTKIVDERTTAVELSGEGKEIITGVFVDISVLDKLPKKRLQRRMICFVMKLRSFICNRSYKKIKSVRNLVSNILKFLCRPFRKSLYFLINWIGARDRKGDYEYAELLAGLPMTYDKKVFESYEMIQFEDTELMIMKDYIDYLEKRYKRKEFYKYLPEGVEPPKHFIYVNISKPYKQYKTELTERV